MIGIIGLGWLGLPLAEELVKNGYAVKGSTTSSEKLHHLKNRFSQVFLLKLENGSITGDCKEFFENITSLIITLPPKYKTPAFDFYVAHVLLLLQKAKEHGVEKLIFTSTTGVFEDTLPISTYSEASEVYAFDEKSAVLIEAEKLVTAYENTISSTVVRLGGLVGLDRQPARFISGKELKNPDAPVNLLHLVDAVGILKAIIQKEKPEQVYHAVYPLHQTRFKYYAKKTKVLNLPEPIYLGEHVASVGKEVTSNFTAANLDYTYKKRP